MHVHFRRGKLGLHHLLLREVLSGGEDEHTHTHHRHHEHIGPSCCGWICFYCESVVVCVPSVRLLFLADFPVSAHGAHPWASRRMHTLIHTHSHTHIHTHTRTHIHIHTLAHSHTHTHMHMRTYMYTYLLQIVNVQVCSNEVGMCVECARKC